MKRFIPASLIVAAAGSASAQIAYDSLPGDPGYQTVGLFSGLIGFDDYLTNTTGSDPLFQLTSFQFVGESDTANAVVIFHWYDGGDTGRTTPVATLSETLVNVGPAIYTFTPPANTFVPNFGIMDAVMQGSAKGIFYMTTRAPDVGFNSENYGFGPYSGNPTWFDAFSLQGTPAPEPASMAIIGLGAVALMRRRFSSK